MTSRICVHLRHLRIDRAAWRFIELFTANIRNPNTRRAYARAVGDFFPWCEQRRVRDVAQISPTLVAAYVEHRSRMHAKPTVKQELAAIRMLFDWLVIGNVLNASPAHAVRGPKHVIKRGKGFSTLATSVSPEALS
ncbi:site-specific integrase [Candidatus Binatia bacterium]|nr:site-specific integrase [Candidatus Binatia bacterium]